MALIDNISRYFACEDNAANTTVVDATGTGNGIANSNTSGMSTTAKINNGFDQNGTDEYIDANFAIADGSFSISGWFKPSSFTNQVNPRLFSQLESAPSRGFRAYIGDTGIVTFDLIEGGTFNSVTPQMTLTLNDWNFVVFTHDSGTEITKTYLNGTLVGTMTAKGWDPGGTKNLILGDGTSHNDEFQGIIDEFGIWSRALTQSEITELYNSGAGLAYPFAAGTLRLIKLAGTFVEKPILTKVAGTFVDKPIKIKVGGTFQDA